MDLQEAKRLFFEYDGSRFYMSRDGVEANYREAGVPPETEAAWLRELTRAKLDLLSREANWAVLQFLNHHEDPGHIDEVVCADPRGSLWQRSAFLEELLAYASLVKRSGGDPRTIARAARKVIVEAERLLKRARSEDSTRRIQAVLTEARRGLNEAETG
jgi:hypothetical protein